MIYMTGTDSILDRLPADFFERYYEKEVLYIPSTNDHFNNVLSVKELSDYLDRADIIYPSVRLVQNGKELSKNDYTLNQVPIGHQKVNGVIDTERMMHYFNNGASIVIQGGQRTFNGITKLSRQLSEKFQAPIQANLYITPDKSIGFNPHWDTHDVFVLQIEGTKTWHLYDFEIKLPTKSQAHKGQKVTVPKTQSLELKAGDILYVPRGYVHDAIANDGISAHITMGILAYTWERLFKDTIEKLHEVEDFRNAVFINDPDFETKLAEKIELLKEHLPRLNYEATKKSLQDIQKKRQPPGFKNYFSSLVHKKEINIDSELFINEGLFINIKQQESGISVSFSGKTILVTGDAEAAVSFMLQKKAFKVAELPGPLNDDSKIVWVKKLLAEGLLYI